MGGYWFKGTNERHANDDQQLVHTDRPHWSSGVSSTQDKVALCMPCRLGSSPSSGIEFMSWLRIVLIANSLDVQSSNDMLTAEHFNNGARHPIKRTPLTLNWFRAREHAKVLSGFWGIMDHVDNRHSSTCNPVSFLWIFLVGLSWQCLSWQGLGHSVAFRASLFEASALPSQMLV